MHTYRGGEPPSCGVVQCSYSEYKPRRGGHWSSGERVWWVENLGRDVHRTHAPQLAQHFFREVVRLVRIPYRATQYTLPRKFNKISRQREANQAGRGYVFAAVCYLFLLLGVAPNT